MTAAVLALGANLGDAQRTLADAVQALDADPEVQVTAVSGLWRTAPMGGPEQPDYVNAVVVVETTLTPEAVLELGQRIERDAGRVRDVHWGPRSLDVDLLDVEGVTRDSQALTLPHPRAHLRAFVLVPWAQLTPAWSLAPADEPADFVARWAQRVLAGEPKDAVVLIDEGPWWR